MAGYDNPWEAGGLREDGYWQMDPRAFRGPPAPAWHEPGRSGYSAVDPRDMREPNQGYGMEQNQVPTISPEDSAWLQEMIDSRDQMLQQPVESQHLSMDNFQENYERALRDPRQMTPGMRMQAESVQRAYGGNNPLEAIRREQMRQSGQLMTDPESMRVLRQLNGMQPAKMPRKPATNTDEFLRMRRGE